MSESSLILQYHSDTLLVSFAGYETVYGGIPHFDFLNFLEKYFPTIDKHFYVDIQRDSYHKGITGISESIDETLVYLKRVIQPYKKVIFMGISAGGYAAILFGSILHITAVIAFIPQTIRRAIMVDEKYRDSSRYINLTTVYELYADVSVQDNRDPHHVSHCDRIGFYPNVKITKKNKFSIKEIRDSGELYALLSRMICL